MAAPKAKRTNNWPWKVQEGTRPVRAEQITRSEEFQIRVKGTIPSTVKKYSDEMRCGQEFPPLELAEVKGKLYLIEGWHRYEAAHIKLGHECLEANITPMIWKQAKARASRANVTQGEGLKPADKRRRLSLHIQGGLHRKKNGNLQSYRELEEELGIPRTTLHRYMELDHHSTFKLMGKDNPQSHSAEPPQIDNDPENLRRALQLLRDALECSNKLRDPEKRWEVIKEAESCLEQMKQQDYEDPYEL